MVNQFAMSGTDDSRLVVFVHIPKTAGTTVNSIIAHQYSGNELYEVMMRGMSLRVDHRHWLPKPLLSLSKLRHLRSAVLKPLNVKIVHGHLDLTLSRWLPHNARYFTLLRDPVERAISHYYHYRKAVTDTIQPLAMASSLAEWVSKCGLVEMDNGQTRRLAGAMNVPCHHLTSQTLQLAKTNLAKFAVVGLTERFEESQILLNRAFDWLPFRYPARNVNLHRRRDAVSTDVLKVIEDNNRLDLELYQFAKTLFDKSFNHVEMEAALARLRVSPVVDTSTATTGQPAATCPAPVPSIDSLSCQS